MWSRMFFLVVLLSITWTVDGRSIDESRLPCAFGDRMLKDCEVASTMPEKCVMMVCRNGEVVEEMVGGPMNTGCCVGFHNVMVPNGYKTEHCLPAVCKDSVWLPGQVSPQCCGHCSLYSYSHFITFDSHYYNWQGNCNYTLVKQSHVMENGAAIYTELDRVGSCATAFSHTTFRNDPDTIINITLPSLSQSQVDVNNEMIVIPEERMHFINSSSGNHTVLAYRYNHCIVLLGSSQLTLRYCPLTLDIWAPRVLAGSLSGLCGVFNYDAKDDFTTPAGEVLPLEKCPMEYPETWRAESQTMPMCLQDGTTTSVCNGTKGNKCQAPAAVLHEYTSTCQDVLQSFITQKPQLQVYVDSCAADLCMIAQQFKNDTQSVMDSFMQTITPLKEQVRAVLNQYWSIVAQQLQYLRMIPHIQSTNMMPGLEFKCSAPNTTTTMPVPTTTMPMPTTTMPVHTTTMPVHTMTMPMPTTTIPMHDDAQHSP